MFPNVSSVFFNWTESVQMKIIRQAVSDFEPEDEVLAIVEFEAVIQPMQAKTVNRKPEDQRAWKWWDMWSTTEFEENTLVQDPDGVVFRVQSTRDWSQGGFFHSELTEIPGV